MSTDLGKGNVSERVGHGSPERVPGTLFRAMAALYFRKIPDSCPADLARDLVRRVARSGISYHERTIARQLCGSVSSVPPELEAAMRRVLITSDGLRTEEDVERALTGEGLQVPASQRLAPYLSVNRILPLARLWLHLNPDRSKRSLATRLQQDLLRAGGKADINILQYTLAGKGGLARREVLEKLLMCLKEQGVASEAEALERVRTQQQEVQRSVEGRGFTDCRRFVQLCRVWQLHQRQPSSRQLALRLSEEMTRRGVSMTLNHFQVLVEGKAPWVRRSILVVLEQLVRQDCPEVQDLEGELEKASSDTEMLVDLGWVRAEPIAALARKWIAGHPAVSRRQLAIRVSRTIRRMGYSTTLNTIQSVLGGWKRKTRGFVYRALLKQFGRSTARIPEQDLLRSPRTVDWSALPPGPDEAAQRLARVLSRVGRRARPDLGAYLKEARRYLRTSAHSIHLADVLAVRMECVYKISRHKAADLLLADRDPLQDGAEEPDRMQGDADAGSDSDVA